MLAALQKLVTSLRDDLRDCLDGKTDEPAGRKGQLAEARARVQAEYDATKAAERTAQALPAWREDYLTQVAVAWVLACVFVRYLEDNALVAECWLGGPDDHTRDEAKARHGGFFRENKTANDRDYLLAVFRRTAEIPAARDLFAEGKTPLWVVGPSADAATRLVNFWHERDAEASVPTFAAPDGDTRFLGDLYQDLNEAVRKKYALLQTPVFVEEFILDRTLDPACQEFGFQNVRLIDPTCGSGHFLLGAFDRLMRLWQKHYHELTGHEWNSNDAAGRVLGLKDKYPGQVFGVDINPYAVAIARFRLLIAACRWCGVVRLKNALPWTPQVFCGDSLYYGKRWTVCTNKESGKGGGTAIDPEWDDPYHLEDVANVTRVLSQKYHAVVGNPPYIQGKDAAARKLYRARYTSAHDKFALSAPFTERFWDLCLAEDNSQPAGFVGMITANNFMKREFGKKLIEVFFPAIDLTHVIDTSGAYIPGHGTPTVILFGRNQKPQDDMVRAALGIKGEPAIPSDAAKGVVWSSITTSVDTAGAQTEFVSITDVPRATFAKHPWSIGGGGAADLKEMLDEFAEFTLSDKLEVAGVFGMTNADDVFFADSASFSRQRLEADFIRQLHVGDEIRDWNASQGEYSIFPYARDGDIVPLGQMENIHRWLWPTRTVLANRATFNKGTYLSEGMQWWKWHQTSHERLRGQPLIAFAFVSTHNHYVLDRGNRVFGRTAPILKIKSNSAEGDYFKILGVANSSTACFWLKMVSHNRGDSTDQAGARTTSTPEFNTYEYGASLVRQLPLPPNMPFELPRQLDALAQEYAANHPSAVCKQAMPTRAALDAARQKTEAIRQQMIFLQEELDWECYQLYGLTTEPLTRTGEPLELRLGERAFEIALAQSGEKTAWFDRHRSTPITELPTDWPADYRKLAERRLAEIESNPNVRLIERPEYKRRWSSDTWEDMEQRALRSWLLDRLETERYWPRGEPALRSCDQLANEAAADPEFLQVAEVYKGGLIEPAALITELVTAEAVPYLPVLRYKESGLRKRVEWEATWVLQREEDRLEAHRANVRARDRAAWERLADTFPEDRARLASLDENLKREAVKVRDRHAPETQFEDGSKGTGMVAVLSAGAVQTIEGANAVSGLMTLRDEYRHLESELTRKVTEKYKVDAEVLALEAELAAIPQNPEIAVPPKYASADFLKSDYWRLRGKLDVPKERWVIYPGAERDGDPTPVVTWAGYDHLGQARALAAYYQEAKDQRGWPPEKLIPLLAGLDQLVPWLKQWHNEFNEDFGEKPGDAIEAFAASAAADLRVSMEAIRAWKPAPTAKGRRKKA